MQHSDFPAAAPRIIRKPPLRSADSPLEGKDGYAWKGACVKDRGQNNSHADLHTKRNQKGQNLEERRKAPRFDLFFSMPTLKSIHRADGLEVDLINLSRRGALIDSPERISPGSGIFLRVITEETTYTFKGRVTRCSISPMNARTFQSGIEFDEEFTFLPASIESLEWFECDEDPLK